MRLNFQKRSALDVVSRIIPEAQHKLKDTHTGNLLTELIKIWEWNKI